MWGSEGDALTVLGHGHGPAKLALNHLLQGRGGRWLSVHDVGHGWRPREAAKPPQDFVAIGVRGVRVAHLDPGSYGHDLSEHLDRPGPILQEAAARTGRLKADEQHGGRLLRKEAAQMMQDATARRHAASGDD